MKFRDDEGYGAYPADAIFINVGAGSFSHPRWTNLDVTTDHYDSHRRGSYVEFDLNELKPLPFADGSVSLAYTSHTIEHVKDEAVAAMFAQVHRVLAPGGVFRITYPDAMQYYRCAARGDLSRYFYRKVSWFGRYGIADEEITPVDFVKMGVATGLTAAPVFRVLRESGFSEFWPSTFGGSIAAPMCDTTKFDNSVRDESFYVEAVR